MEQLPYWQQSMHILQQSSGIRIIDRKRPSSKRGKAMRDGITLAGDQTYRSSVKTLWNNPYRSNENMQTDLDIFLEQAYMNLQQLLSENMDNLQYVNEYWDISSVPFKGKNLIINTKGKPLGIYDYTKEQGFELHKEKDVPKDYSGLIYATDYGALYTSPVRGQNIVFENGKRVDELIID